MVFKKLRGSFRRSKKESSKTDTEPTKKEVVEPEPTPTPEEKPEDVEAKETREEGTVKSETEDHASATGEEDNDQASQPDHVEQVESSIETKAQKDALTCCGVTIDVA